MRLDINLTEAKKLFPGASEEEIKKRKRASYTEAEKVLLDLGKQALEHILAAQTVICSMEDPQFSMEEIRNGTSLRMNEIVDILDDVNDELHPLRDKLQILLGVEE